MNILVLVKQVPGTTQVEVDPETGVLKRDGVAAKLNPYDLFALEEAFLLRERTGGTVTALTMGPPQARDALAETIAMGADAAALLSDRRLAGADVLATSYALSQAAQAVLPDFDVLICGKQTTDGDTAQVGPELAELLDVPHAANVGEILGAADGKLTVKTAFETHFLTQELPLPCLITIEKDANTPRLPSYRRYRALRPEHIRTLTLDDLGDRDETHYGLAGSPTQVERIFPPEKGVARERYEGSGAELGKKLHALLAEKKFV